jgi:hypothetical protein
LRGTIPSQIALMSNLCESSVVWLLVVMIVVSCFFLYSHVCLSFLILQITWISTAIISRVNSRVLPLLMIVGSRVILGSQTHILKLAVPFRET